jgi:ribonuclease E
MSKLSPRRAVIALVAGVVAIPTLVLASTAMLGSESADTAPQPQTVVQSVAPADVPATTSTTQASVGATVSEPADIATACGPEGAQLVAAEAAGELNELQQAALDALRPICEEAGMPLSGPPLPPPIVVIETVMPLPAATSASSTVYDDDVEDEREDHDDDRDDEDDDDDGDEDD